MSGLYPVVTALSLLQSRDSYLASVSIEKGGFQTEIYRTLDGGAAWTHWANAPERGDGDAVGADATGNHMFFLDAFGSEYETTDAGKTWEKIVIEQDVDVITITDPRQCPIYFGTNHGVFVRECR